MSAMQLFPQSFLDERAKTFQGRLTETGRGDIVDYGARLVSDRLQKDPKRYLDYGPYWWALKKILSAKGYLIIGEMDESMADAYRGATDAQTLVAAEAYRDDYLASHMLYDRKHQLDDDPEVAPYALFDEDMESLP